MFAINHYFTDSDRIEKFEFLPNEKTLKHVKTFENEKFFGMPNYMSNIKFENFKLKFFLKKFTFQNRFHNFNDLTAIGGDKFFASVDCYFSKDFLKILENVFAPNLGSFFYFDGKDGHSVDTFMGMPNGVVYDSARKILFKLLATSSKYLIF